MEAKIRHRIREIESFAEDLVRLAGIEKPPVEPGILVRNEPINIIGDDFGSAFDGRLEVQEGTFLLFYNTYGGNPFSPRCRFSIGHELGHYFVDEHRECLVRGGEPHDSKAGFAVDNIVEREADFFAASLLMPRFLFAKKANDPDIQSLVRLSDEFRTSLTSTAIRLVSLSEFPCAVIVSKNCTVQYSFFSEDLEARNFCYIPSGSRISTNAPTYTLASDQQKIAKAEFVEGTSYSSLWRDRDRGPELELWEQSIGLGKYGQVLTLLTYEPEE